MLLDDSNATRFESIAEVFCLTADPQSIVDRVTHDGLASRPLLDVANPLAAVSELLADRAAAYARFVQIETSDRSIDDVVAEIRARLLAE